MPPTVLDSSAATREVHPAQTGPIWRLRAPSAQGSTPLAAVEWLRLGACVGIVAFHMQVPGMRIAYSGLPAFAILTVAFAARSADRGRDPRAFVSARVRRLGAPWLFWSMAYAVLLTVLTVRDGAAPLSWVRPHMLLTGPIVVLWYLPFALAASLLAGGWVFLQRRPGGDAGARRGGGWPAWTIAGAAAVVVCSWGVHGLDVMPPIPQWVFAAPAVPLGLALAAVAPGARGGTAALGCFALAVVVACAGAAGLGHTDLAVPFGVAGAACAVAWALPQRAGRLTLGCSSVTFGIYLLHPLFLLVLYKYAPMHVSRWTGVALVVVAAAAATALLRMTPLRRVL